MRYTWDHNDLQRICSVSTSIHQVALCLTIQNVCQSDASQAGKSFTYTVNQLIQYSRSRLISETFKELILGNPASYWPPSVFMSLDSLFVQYSASAGMLTCLRALSQPGLQGLIVELTLHSWFQSWPGLKQIYMALPQPL